MFAVITPALMTGAFADRFRFKPYLIFIVLWLLSLKLHSADEVGTEKGTDMPGLFCNRPLSQVLRLGQPNFSRKSAHMHPYAIFLLAKSSHCLDLVDPLCVPICIICYHWPFLDFQAYRTGIIGSEVAKHQFSSGHSGLIYSSCDCFWVASFSLLLMPLRTPHWVLCFWTSFVFAKSSFLLHVGLLHLTDQHFLDHFSREIMGFSIFEW